MGQGHYSFHAGRNPGDGVHQLMDPTLWAKMFGYLKTLNFAIKKNVSQTIYFQISCRLLLKCFSNWENKWWCSVAQALALPNVGLQKACWCFKSYPTFSPKYGSNSSMIHTLIFFQFGDDIPLIIDIKSAEEGCLQVLSICILTAISLNTNGMWQSVIPFEFYGVIKIH